MGGNGSLDDYQVPIGCTAGEEDYAAGDDGDDPQKDLQASADIDAVDPMKEAVMRLSNQVDYFGSWLLRGERNPLRAMGLWHYSMFVYSVGEKDAMSDFATYRYHSAHINYELTAQKLRLDEAPRVVRLR